MTINTMNHLMAGYRIPRVQGRGDNVVTHKTFSAAYRGAGRPEAAFVIERLMDRAAPRHQHGSRGAAPAEPRARGRDAVRAALSIATNSGSFTIWCTSMFRSIVC